MNIRTSILSVSVPGALFVPDPEGSARVARSMNQYAAALRDKDPLAYGFFATLPSLEHTDLVLREVRYAFDTLHADGVNLFTSYMTSEGYLGHREYLPVWEELNARKAVVFVHPINNKAAVSFDERLPFPAFDWPHETGRTAMDIILKGRLKQFPDVKIILSHAGGTLPSLISRAGLIAQPEFGAVMSAQELISQAKQFYFDLALSGSPEVFPLILSFAEKDHILFGSDYPAATNPISVAHADFIDKYKLDGEKRKELYHGAAGKLFPRLKGAFDV